MRLAFVRQELRAIIDKSMISATSMITDKSMITATSRLFPNKHSITSATDAVTNDVKYHKVYWIYAQREASRGNTDEIQERDAIERVVADKEIINIVQLEFSESSDCVLEMKQINKMYNALLAREDEENYKGYLKQLLLESIPGIVFSRPPVRNQ